MLTREEFEQLRIESAKRMAEDRELFNRSIELISKADSYRWIHQTNWKGEPCLQLPQDLFAIQEIIYKTKPDFVVEIGVCWGGTTLFLSSLETKVIGVDVYIPADLRKRIRQKYDHYEPYLIEGSSVEISTFEKVKREIDSWELPLQEAKIMVILDSNHSKEHVKRELELYTPLIKTGGYCVVCDTIIEDIKNPTRHREWGPGNSPRTAIQEFLENDDRFAVDEDMKNKLLLSCQPDGYLRKIYE